MDIEYSEDLDYGDDYAQYGGLTCFDHLEIRDGTSEHSQLLDGYCGDAEVVSLPITIQSTQNHVWMR